MIIDNPHRQATEQIEEAYNAFSKVQSVHFKIETTEGIDFWHKRFGFVEAFLAYDGSSNPGRILFECREYSGAKIQPKTLVRRVVGDGATYWQTDASTATYTATPYGGVGARQGFVKVLLDKLGDGPSSLISKLLFQVSAATRRGSRIGYPVAN